MKKLISVLLTLMLLGASTLAFAEVPVPTETALDDGVVETYAFDGITLYAYNTGDLLDDTMYAFASDEGIVVLESAAFKATNNTWKKFLEATGKPIVATIMAYHPNGYDTYGVEKPYATANALENWAEGGSIRVLTTDQFIPGFGDVIADTFPSQSTEVAFGDTITLAGIDFVICDEGDDAFGVEIPAINTKYIHMMGSDVHNILTSVAHIDAFIAELEGYDYDLILTSHYAPEGREAVAAKIAYLNTVKELAAKCETADAFTAAMNEAFPEYSGSNYLDMTTGFLYAE